MNIEAKSLLIFPQFLAFDIPGVKEHAHFLKDVKDARKIRGRVLECQWQRFTLYPTH